MGNRFFREETGLTLIELILAVAIGLIVMGMAMGSAVSLTKSSRADGGLANAVSGLRAAREMAISSRRNVRVTFPTTNQILNTRVEYCAAPCSGGPATTVVRTTNLEGRVIFRSPSPITTDTGDAFGNAATDGINLGPLANPMFTTDGSFVNSNGDVLNGTIFLGVPNETLSLRAISIFGPTGAMRMWKWNGRAWVEA